MATTTTVDAAVGDRVELVFTDDPYTRLKPGDQGTVLSVYGDVIAVAWDSGSTLALITSAGDRFTKI